MNDARVLQLSQAIQRYFDGEKGEMLAILAGSLAMLILAAGLFIHFRDGFARGFGLAVLAGVLLSSGAATSLLLRDRAHQAVLLEELQAGSAEGVAARESDRIEVVISKYPAYRYASLILGAIALAAAAWISRGWVMGSAVGVLLIAAAQLTIDHYSEARARAYLQQVWHGSSAAQS